jgi:hypothetical protein
MKSVVNFFWSQKPLESLWEKNRKLILTLVLSSSRDPFRKKSCLLDSSSVSSNSVYVVVPKRALKAKSCRDPTTYHAVRIGGALTILRHQIPSRNHLYHQLPLRHHGHLALTVLPLLLLLSQNATKNSPEKTRFLKRISPKKTSTRKIPCREAVSSPPTQFQWPQLWRCHSPSSFTVRVAHKREREREELWSDRTVETTDLPDGVARRELERWTRGVSKLPTSPKESQVGRKLAWVKKRRLLTL